MGPWKQGSPVRSLQGIWCQVSKPFLAVEPLVKMKSLVKVSREKFLCLKAHSASSFCENPPGNHPESQNIEEDGLKPADLTLFT